MSAIQNLRSKEFPLKNNGTLPIKKLTDQNIFSDMHVIVNSIDPKRISKVPANRLTINSAVKAGLVFLGTLGVYYLAKTTVILSYFGRGSKNSKDVGSSEITKVKNRANTLTVRKNLETAR
jgi:hypothetical protein